MLSDNEIEKVGTELRDRLNSQLLIKKDNVLKGRERDLIITSLYIIRAQVFEECLRVVKEHKCDFNECLDEDSNGDVFYTGNCATSITQVILKLKEKK